MNKKQKLLLKRIVKDRISFLISLAHEIYDIDRALSTLYVRYAFSLVKRYKVKLNQDKLRFCRKCFTVWNKETSSLSKSGNFIEYKCKICNYKRKRFVKQNS